MTLLTARDYRCLPIAMLCRFTTIHECFVNHSRNPRKCLNARAFSQIHERLAPTRKNATGGGVGKVGRNAWNPCEIDIEGVPLTWDAAGVPTRWEAVRRWPRFSFRRKDPRPGSRKAKAPSPGEVRGHRAQHVNVALVGRDRALPMLPVASTSVVDRSERARSARCNQRASRL